MGVFAERLIQALEIRGMSAAELSRRLGVDEGTVSNYKKGRYEPKQLRLQKISDTLNVSIAWLLGADVPMETIDNIVPVKRVRYIPILGKIACGEPILAEENQEGKLMLPEQVNADFALICKGDSMIDARIYDGDIVYIQQQPTVENGEIAAVLINNESTLKRFYQKGDTVILKPEKSDMEPLIFTKEQLNEIKIIGKAVYFLSEVK